MECRWQQKPMNSSTTIACSAEKSAKHVWLRIEGQKFRSFAHLHLSQKIKVLRRPVETTTQSGRLALRSEY